QRRQGRLSASLGRKGDGLQDQNLNQTAAASAGCGRVVQPQQQGLGGLQVALRDQQTGQREVIDFIQIGAWSAGLVQATGLAPVAGCGQVTLSDPEPGLAAGSRG